MATNTRCVYDARIAGLRARRARFKCRTRSKLASDTVLFGVVEHFLARGWSPSQIAGTLKLMWPDEPQRTVSHETISTCIYAMPKGELRKDLIACVRRAKAKRMPRSRDEDRRGQMPDLLSIHVRPLEANDRAFPGHWEGDLIKGAGDRSAVGVLLERSSRLVMLIKLTDATAASALEGFTAKLRSIAEPMRQTLTYDQGKEMARHPRFLPAHRRLPGYVGQNQPPEFLDSINQCCTWCVTLPTPLHAHGFLFRVQDQHESKRIPYPNSVTSNGRSPLQHLHSHPKHCPIYWIEDRRSCAKSGFLLLFVHEMSLPFE